MTIKELIIYVLFTYKICTYSGDDLNEVVPDCPELTKGIKNLQGFYRIYARLTETDDDFKFGMGLIDKKELKLYTYVYYSEYGTYRKDGHKCDGMINKVRMVVYTLDGKKQKTSTYKPKRR